MATDPHHSDWQAIALRRAARMFSEWRVLNQHMLESKVSESGPYIATGPSGQPAPPSKRNQRAQPPVVRSAVGRLVTQGQVVAIPAALLPAGITGTVYAHHTVSLTSPSRSDADRLATVGAALKTYQQATRKQALCGDILEAAAYDAALAARQAGASSLVVLGTPGTPYVGPINGKSQLRPRPLDLILLADSVPVGLEAKNLRQWLHAAHLDVWELLQKCLVVDAVPLLVTRKVLPSLLRLFGLIGGLAFATNNQLFAPSLGPAAVNLGGSYPFADVLSKSGLNFFDIRFSTEETTRRLALFMQNTLVPDASDRLSRFRDAAPILRKYAFEADGLTPRRPSEKDVNDCIEELSEEFGPNF